MKRKLVIYIGAWSCHMGEAIEEEAHQWLREFGVEEPEFDVITNANNSEYLVRDYPVRFEVRATQIPAAATEDGLVERLSVAWDVGSITPASMAELEEQIANSMAYQADEAARTVTYDDAGLRSDVPADIRRILSRSSSVDLAAVNGDASSELPSHVAEYAHWLEDATGGMYMWDHDALWKHRVRPQEPGKLIWACNDDGLMAVEDPTLISHITGLDRMPPHINRSSPPVRVDDLLARIIDDTREQLLGEMNVPLLLRESFFAHELDYNHALLNPGWEPHPAVGSMTGWVVHPEAEVPRVEPFGTNNDRYISWVDQINAFFQTIGGTRVEWATAHDLLVTRHLEPELEYHVRRFVCDLIIDLILARAGELSFGPDESWMDFPARTIPEDQPTMRAQLVVEGKTLYEIRLLLEDFRITVTQPFTSWAHRSSSPYHSHAFSSNSVSVEIETTASEEAEATLQRLVNLLGAPAAVSEGLYPRFSRKRDIVPR